MHILEMKNEIFSSFSINHKVVRNRWKKEQPVKKNYESLFIDLDEEQWVFHTKFQNLVCILIWEKDLQYWKEKK